MNAPPWQIWKNVTWRIPDVIKHTYEHKQSYLISRIDLWNYYQLTYSDWKVYDVRKEQDKKKSRRKHRGNDKHIKNNNVIQENIEDIIEEIKEGKEIIEHNITYLKSRSRQLARKIKIDVKNCEYCWYWWKLEVHHINKDALDNSEHNLVKICIQCHFEIHKDEWVSRIMKKRMSNDFIL